jgi:hypothetical protein
LDDITVFSCSAAEHDQHLRTVLATLRQHRLFAKLSKCAFNKPEVAYLGHIVGRNGLRMDPKKVEVVRTWRTPRTATELRSFLGLCNYFSRFIQGYSSVVACLHELLRKGVAFVWGTAHQHAFERLKQLLTTAPVLALPDFSKPFEVVSDASLNGTGAVLLQDRRPLAYTSRKFTPAERNYTTGDQELLGIIHALKEVLP